MVGNWPPVTLPSSGPVLSVVGCVGVAGRLGGGVVGGNSVGLSSVSSGVVGGDSVGVRSVSGGVVGGGLVGGGGVGIGKGREVQGAVAATK